MEIYFDELFRGERTAGLQVAEPRSQTVQPAQSPQHSSRLRELQVQPGLLRLPGALQVQVLRVAEEGDAGPGISSVSPPRSERDFCFDFREN